MPIDIERQILTVLQGIDANSKPATLSDLARRFGVSSQLISLHAKHLIADGKAEGSMVLVRGVPTLHGLLPQLKPTAG